MAASKAAMCRTMRFGTHYRRNEQSSFLFGGTYSVRSGIDSVENDNVIEIKSIDEFEPYKKVGSVRHDQ